MARQRELRVNIEKKTYLFHFRNSKAGNVKYRVPTFFVELPFGVKHDRSVSSVDWNLSGTIQNVWQISTYFLLLMTIIDLLQIIDRKKRLKGVKVFWSVNEQCGFFWLALRKEKGFKEGWRGYINKCDLVHFRHFSFGDVKGWIAFPYFEKLKAWKMKVDLLNI